MFRLRFLPVFRDFERKYKIVGLHRQQRWDRSDPVFQVENFRTNIVVEIRNETDGQTVSQPTANEEGM